MAFHRSQRVADEIRAALSDAILRRMSDPRARLVTITAVRVSSDIRHARVWVGWIGEPGGRADAIALLCRAAGFLQREIGKTLRLKFMPRLRFLADETEENAARIYRALDEIAAPDTGPSEEPDAGPPDDSDAGPPEEP